MALNPEQRMLRNTRTGATFTWTQALANRGDMVPHRKGERVEEPDYFEAEEKEVEQDKPPSRMNKSELVAFAKMAFGVDLDRDMSAEKMRDRIRELKVG